MKHLSIEKTVLPPLPALSYTEWLYYILSVRNNLK